jgi:hypothetical protein
VRGLRRRGQGSSCGPTAKRAGGRKKHAFKVVDRQFKADHLCRSQQVNSARRSSMNTGDSVRMPPELPPVWCGTGCADRGAPVPDNAVIRTTWPRSRPSPGPTAPASAWQRRPLSWPFNRRSYVTAAVQRASWSLRRNRVATGSNSSEDRGPRRCTVADIHKINDHGTAPGYRSFDRP